MSVANKSGGPERACGVIFFNDVFPPHDNTGCLKPEGHAGPHEFISQDDRHYAWETDWSCTCSECLSDDGEMCAIYWEV